MAKDDSKQRFLEAGHGLLADGMELGVNLVAKRAGLNKVLLYRYFTDWEGYLASLAAGLNLWKDIRGELEAGLAVGRWVDAAAAATWVLDAYQAHLRQAPSVLTIMANEQARCSPLLRHLDEEREREGSLIMQALLLKWPALPRQRMALLSALLSAGLSHLALRSRQVQFFSGLDLGEESTWEALMAEIEGMAGRLLR